MNPAPSYIIYANSILLTGSLRLNRKIDIKEKEGAG